MTIVEPLLLSGESVEWMQRLAREHEAADAWVSSEDVAPPECFRPLLWLGVVEQEDISFRLTDLGWWALGNFIVNADD